MQTENTYVETDLGNIALNPRGEYSDEASYEYLDTVSYKGGSYTCLAELTKTISGIAPAQGKNTEHWQVLTLPGGLTSDYVAMHDDVVNKAKQIETSRAAVELSQQEVEAAQADVSQMRQDTQEASQTAIASRDSAAGYAQSAEASRTATAESEQNINAQVTGFDTHVTEKTSAAETAVEEVRKTAINAITTQQDVSTKAVTDEGTTQTKMVGGAGNAAVSAVAKQQAASVQAVEDAGTAQVTAIESAGNEQITEVNKAGTTQVENVEEAGNQQNVILTEAAAQELIKLQEVAKQFAGDHEQIETNKEDISNKITKFYASNQGETHLADSDNGKIMDMMLYGKSEQFTTIGKNLLKIKDGTQTLRGVTVTANDGVVALKGTAVESGWAILTIDSFVLDGTYILSSNISSNVSSNVRVIVVDKSFKSILKEGESANLENAEASKVCFTVTEGETYDISNILIQIEKGSVATSYEPYTGGIPSPNPSYPQEIKSVVNPIVKLSNEDGTQSETVTLPYTLNAIPVSSGGNVTIDGQQYIADYVDVERGKLVKRVYEYVFSGEGRWNAAVDGAQYLAWHAGDNPGIIDSTYDKKCLCSCLIANIMNTTRKGENYISTQSFNDTCRVWVSANVVTSKLTGEKVFLALIVPEEISLTQEEIRAFKELAAYYPVTNVNVASEQLNGYTVFNYPVSMKNGWNYVKQQLNDNRDYIYDMDLQSTEAYVNSEYAVALTELEV
jgi:hypothetical protein